MSSTDACTSGFCSALIIRELSVGRTPPPDDAQSPTHRLDNPGNPNDPCVVGLEPPRAYMSRTSNHPLNVNHKIGGGEAKEVHAPLSRTIHEAIDALSVHVKMREYQNSMFISTGPLGQSAWS